MLLSWWWVCRKCVPEKYLEIRPISRTWKMIRYRSQQMQQREPFEASVKKRQQWVLPDTLRSVPWHFWLDPRQVVRVSWRSVLRKRQRNWNLVSEAWQRMQKHFLYMAPRKYLLMVMTPHIPKHFWILLMRQEVWRYVLPQVPDLKSWWEAVKRNLCFIWNAAAFMLQRAVEARESRMVQ